MWPQGLLNYCEAAGPSHAIFNQFFDVIVVLASFRLVFYLSIKIREKIYNFEHVYFSWFVVLTQLLLDDWQFCKTFWIDLQTFPIGVHRCSEIFPEQPIKCIIAYMLHNKSYRITPFEYFFVLSTAETMLSHCWVSLKCLINDTLHNKVQNLTFWRIKMNWPVLE